ncbi:MAG: aminofutalosine synthase MqnE [Deltaproteobacteria bacterium]|nr:aminofutalosine synthase MqnE [Deltaproteobacteria bacterium]
MSPRTAAELSPSTLRGLRAAGLGEVADKVLSDTRLSFEDGVLLAQSTEVALIGALANLVRERRHGDRVYFNRNVHINATNVCEASCVFCSFARLKTGDKDAWTMGVEDALKRLRVLDDSVLTEVHIVNGLNPDLPYDYYTTLLSAIKAHRPDLHIKGFTAVEIHYYAQKYGMTYAEVLQTLVAAGLDSIPGGGAEIFHPRARKKLCDDKVDAEGWLEVHRVAHRLGLKSNCTMLFGSIETLEERVDHLLRLRALQDESLSAAVTDPQHGGGHFQVFIPLRFHNDNNRLARLASPTGYDSLRTIALSRLLLDNIPHVKAYWPMLGTHEAQAALWFGASDLDGTVREEHIYHMAGAETPQGLSRADLVDFIGSARRVPIERDTLYDVILREDPPAPLAPCPVPARLGWVGYTNALPLIQHLDRDQLSLRAGHPAEVAQWLRDGEIDLALLPVGALLSDSPARHGRDRAGGGWSVVPDVCIGADGPVDSVLLVGDLPPEQWEVVQLDALSRSSVMLARLLLEHGPLKGRLRADLRVVEVPSGQGLVGVCGAVAGLVIGDRALALGEAHPHRLDLAAEWRAWTGMAAVFAVWAGRPDLDPAVVEHVRAAGLRGAADVAAGRLPPGLSPAHQRYLRENIRYQLDDRATMGLMRFAALAQRAGLAVRGSYSLYAPARPPVVDDSDVYADLNDAVLGLPLPAAALQRLLLRARLPELLAAADARRAALHPQGATYALRGETQAGGPVEVERDLTDPLDGIPAGPVRLRLRLPAEAGAEAVVAGLRALDSLGERLLALTLLPPVAGARPAAGAAVDGSAVAYLRVLALLRLALPGLPHVVGAHEAYGRGLAQVACRGGADDIGVVMAHSEAHRMEDGVWPMTEREAERCLRQAGLEPARRDAAFRRVGGALTGAEAAGPLRRLDATR